MREEGGVWAEAGEMRESAKSGAARAVANATARNGLMLAPPMPMAAQGRAARAPHVGRAEGRVGSGGGDRRVSEHR